MLKYIIIIMVLITIPMAVAQVGQIKVEKKPITETTYTYNSKTVCDEYDCNSLVYSGPTFADDKGTKLKNAKSWKDCQFCNKIKLKIDVDPNQPDVEVLDYNATSISLCTQANLKSINKDVDIKSLSKKDPNIKYKEKKVKYKNVVDKSCDYFPFGNDKKIKIGKNSTEIYFVAGGHGYVLRSSFLWDLVHDDTTGNAYVGTVTPYTRTSSSNTYYIGRGFIPFNTTSLNDTNISSASINYYTAYGQLQENNEHAYYVFVGNTSQASMTTLVDDDYDNCGSVDNPIEFTERINISGSSYMNHTNILNSHGIAAINSGGFTKIGVRLGWDIDDVPPATNKINYINIVPSESYLNITFGATTTTTTTTTTTNPCNCPGDGNNWQLNLSLHCEVNSSCSLGTGNITLVETGWANFTNYLQTKILNGWNAINRELIFNSPSSELNISG